MVVLTYIGIGLLCLGYLVLVFMSLSSKPEQDTKKTKSVRSKTPVAVYQSKKHPSSPSRNATSL